MAGRIGHGESIATEELLEAGKGSHELMQTIQPPGSFRYSADSKKSGKDESANSTSKPQPEPWTTNQPYHYYLKSNEGDPWATLKTGVDKYDEDMCQGWREELDTMLVFTGLFSAIATAFLIESWKKLFEDSSDTTNAILLILSQQLSNSSAPTADTLHSGRFVAATNDIQTNVLYFTSLTLALSVSSACILGKQWIREYRRDLTVSARDALRVRQARFDALHAWKLPTILAAVPVILQAALLLFFAGMLNQLWHANDHTTAIVVSVIVGFTVLMIFVTAIIPAHCSGRYSYQSFTPFRSPQAWMYFTIYQQIRRAYHAWPRSSLIASWTAFDTTFLSAEGFTNPPVLSAHSALRWIFKAFKDSTDKESALFWCIQKAYAQTEDPAVLRYVVDIKTRHPAGVDSVDSVCYDLSCQVGGRECGIGQARGRFQVELLIRYANWAMDQLKESEHGNLQDFWNVVTRSCSKMLVWHQIFDPYACKEAGKDAGLIHAQICVMLQRIFETLAGAKQKPPPQFDWYTIIHLLVNLEQERSLPLAQTTTQEFAPDAIRRLLQTHRNASLISALGQATVDNIRGNWEYGLRLFSILDEIMVEWCHDQEGVPGLDMGQLQRWSSLRFEMWNEGKSQGSEQHMNQYFHNLHPARRWIP